MGVERKRGDCCRSVGSRPPAHRGRRRITLHEHGVAPPIAALECYQLVRWGRIEVPVGSDARDRRVVVREGGWYRCEDRVGVRRQCQQRGAQNSSSRSLDEKAPRRWAWDSELSSSKRMGCATFALGLAKRAAPWVRGGGNQARRSGLRQANARGPGHTAVIKDF